MSAVGEPQEKAVMPASHPMHSPEAASRFFWTPAQTAAIAIGAVSPLIGLLEFLHGASLFYCVVHAIVGFAGIALARTLTTARNYLIGGGAVYLVLFAYDLLAHRNGSANPSAVTNGGTGVHLSLALAMIAAGTALSRNRNTRPAPAGRTENTTPRRTAY